MERSADQHTILCPSCGLANLSLSDYSTLMVVRPELGLFTIICPNCKAKVSSIQSIPPELMPEVVEAAQEVGAGMGADLNER